MGVKKLNSYLLRNCTNNSIHNISIKDLKDKTIVVDTSIYIYRFIENGKLLENIFKMVSMFIQHNVKLIFVFDGKPDERKNSVIQKRIEKRNKANEIYHNIVNDTIDNMNEEKKLVLEKLRKRGTKINYKDIENLKNALSSMGIEYYESYEESDQLCTYLVNTDKAWACLSDDMDMIVHGCKRLIRNWIFGEKSGCIYIYDSIISELNIDKKDALRFLLLLGTDYGTKRVHIEKVFSLYNEFKRSQTYNCFYDWIKFNDRISTEDIEKIESIFDIYEIPQYINVKKIDVNFNLNKLKQLYSNTIVVF